MVGWQSAASSEDLVIRSNAEPLCAAAAAEMERILEQHERVCRFSDRMTTGDLKPLAWKPADRDADAVLAWTAFRAKGAIDPDILPSAVAESETTLQAATADVDGDGRAERVYRAILRSKGRACDPDGAALTRHAIFVGPADAPRMRRLGRHNMGDFADLIDYRGNTYLIQEDIWGMTFYRAGGADPDDGAVDLTKVCGVSSGSAMGFTF